jgi:hypothetical protein
MTVCHTWSRPARLCGLAIAVAWSAESGAALRHRYSFNDGTAQDSVGEAHGVPVHGAPITNGAVAFDPLVNNGTNTDAATGQYIQLPKIPLWRNTSLDLWFTWEGGQDWQRVLDIGRRAPYYGDPSQYIGTGFVIIAVRNFGGSYGYLGQISHSTWGQPADTDYTFSGDETVGGGVERHWTLVQDLDHGLQSLYVDGVRMATATARVDLSTAPYTNFFLGRSQFSWDPFFRGRINEVRIYDHALAPDEVALSEQNGPDQPASMPRLKLLMSPEGVGVGFFAEPGARYRLEGSPALDGASWSPVGEAGPFPLGLAVRIPDPATARWRLYRVLTAP